MIGDVAAGGIKINYKKLKVFPGDN